MTNRTKSVILAVALLQVILIVGLLALPSAVQAIPGRYRIWLQENQPVLSDITEGVIEQVAPVATALPAPAQAGEQVDLAGLINQPASGGAVDPAVTAAEGLSSGRPAASTIEITATASTVEGALPTPATTPTLAATPAAEATATLQPTATLEPTPTTTPTPEPLPERVILEGMGVIAQSFNNCGPANLTQVLNWYGSDITQEDVASYLKPNPEDRNVSPWQIADYVNEIIPGSGLLAITRAGGTLEMVKRFLAAGYPVVIEKGYELPDSGWWGHYLTVFGYDDAKGELYSQDTYLGPWDGSGRVDSYEDVEHYWQHFNNTFYVVYRPDQEAEVQAILGEDMFDDFTMWQSVAAFADEQTKANPDDAFSWFNLGTALTRMGSVTGEAQYYQGGAQAYDRAREIGLPPRMLWYQFEPYLAYLRVDRYQDIIDLANATLETQGGRNVEETFLYQGHALAYLGDVNGAITAYQQALTVNENFYPAQIALDAVQ
jgi:hypothetical protein